MFEQHLRYLVVQLNTQIQLWLMVCKSLYSNFTIAKKNVSIADLGIARWHLFSKHQWESESSSLKFKIYHSHYISLIWKYSYISKPLLPDPNLYGWEAIHSGLVAISTESTICHCKMKCPTKQSKCNKLNLKCSKTCFYIDCENSEDYDDAISDTHASDCD